MDSDLISSSREDLIAEVLKLRNGIRKHRNSSGQELCWHHPEFSSLLPEKLIQKLKFPIGRSL